MELQDVLEQRYSCRSFSDEVPSQEAIEAVLEAGRLAPTACNNQPQRIYVAQGEEALAKIDACTRCRYNAPVCFVIGYDVDEAAFHGPDRFTGSEFSFGEHDATSVLVHMALKAADLGMNTCWLGAIDDAKLHEVFAIPENINIRAILDFGFASEKGVPAPLHTKRKPLEETVTWV